jgi:hypothetical protein
MSNAWEVSEEDVRNVLHDIGMTNPSQETVDNVLSSIDTDLIESCALYGDTIEDQVELAYKEMRRQIEDDRLLE